MKSKGGDGLKLVRISRGQNLEFLSYEYRAKTKIPHLDFDLILILLVQTEDWNSIA